ncbi:MAG: phosphate regulon sensor protein PhoR [Gammaproteobacteria bacterium]|nr:phosphate regulon sensor protein PhoR [Gammaproteobacteria bacterium]
MVIIDWMLPGMSGLDLARRLRRDALTAELPLLMLTARGDEADKLRSFDVGIDDYVTKPFSPRELVARIRAVLRRTGAPEGGQLQFGDLVLDTQSHRLSIAGDNIHAGPTEFRLLEFLMRHPDRAFDREQLLDRVWGRSVYVEERTVDVHILRLRKVLAPHDKAGWVQTVRGVGYRFSPTPENCGRRHGMSGWGAEIGRLLALSLVGAVCGALLGAPMAGAFFGLLGHSLWRMSELRRFDDWLSHSIGHPPPLGATLEDIAQPAPAPAPGLAAPGTRRLTRTLRQLQRATNALPDAAVLLDGRDGIVWFNEAGTRLLGLRRGDVHRSLSVLLRAPEIHGLLANDADAGSVEMASPANEKRLLEVRLVSYTEDRRLLLARDVTQIAELRTMRQDSIADNVFLTSCAHR